MTEETVFKGNFLLFHYGHWFGRLLTWLLYSRIYYSKIYGFFQRTKSSRAGIEAFIKTYGVRADEAEKPPDQYRDFNEFFTRRLKPGLRPVDQNPAALIAPCDGRLLAYRLDGDTAVPVKGRAISVRALLGDNTLAGKYQGGLCLVFRLAPADYHRFCYVDNGWHGPVRRLGGRLHSVHPLCLSSGAPVFEVNYRELCVLETENFGDVVHIDVGAMRVGKICQSKPEGGSFSRGEEKGYFEFGASTVILVLAAGMAEVDADIALRSREGIETLVKMGEKTGYRLAPG